MVVAVDYIDQLARLRLSRQQASVLIQLYDMGPTNLHPWAVKPASRSESASTSRMLHSLKDRGYIKLMAMPGHARYTHLVLTDDGRRLASMLKAVLL